MLARIYKTESPIKTGDIWINSHREHCEVLAILRDELRFTKAGEPKPVTIFVAAPLATRAATA